MRIRPLLAALGGAALALPTPAPAAGALGTPGRPPKVPCPTITVTRPARPSPPTPDQQQRAVGGPGLASAGLAIPAGAPKPARLTATSWLVADLGSGAVLGACGAHEYATPASVQKLLLAATFMPKLNPAQVVAVTHADMNFEPGSSAVGLVEGGRYSIESLWLSLLLKSGNDAANVLARVGGGTSDYRAGVAAMNAEARRLGARQTHAVTPSGLDGPGQFTSAYDLALIARACYARADFRRYTATRTASVADHRNGSGTIQLNNDNGMLQQYPGMLGGKTGFTDLARQTYVGVAERHSRRLVVTLLGAESGPLGSFGEVGILLDWGFALPGNAFVGRLVEPGAASASPSASRASPPAAPPPEAQRTAASPGTAIGLAVVTAAVLVALVVFRRRARERALSTAGDRTRGWFARHGQDGDGDPPGH